MLEHVHVVVAQLGKRERKKKTKKTLCVFRAFDSSSVT